MEAETYTYVYILPEYALSDEEGRTALAVCLPHLQAGERVILDMSRCHVLCTHWLSGFYSPLFDEYPVAEVERAVVPHNASKTNQQAIDLMYESAWDWARRRTAGECELLD